MSSRDMTLTEFKNTTKAFDDSHTVKVKDLKTGGGTKKPRNTQPPKYFLDFQKQMLDLFKQVITRIDNLVSKNNLKE